MNITWTAFLHYSLSGETLQRITFSAALNKIFKQSFWGHDGLKYVSLVHQCVIQCEDRVKSCVFMFKVCTTNILFHLKSCSSATESCLCCIFIQPINLQSLYFPNYSIIPAKLLLSTWSLGNLTKSLLCLLLSFILSYISFLSTYLIL